MTNFEHEVLCPENKGMEICLWYDYFDDSDIDTIRFEWGAKRVWMEIESQRDETAVWKALKCDLEALKKYVAAKGDPFRYILQFRHVEYFHMERDMSCGHYIKGRFRQTACLMELQKKSKRPLYHFRIQLADGYVDIVFSDFIIRKKQGRVKYYDKTLRPVKRREKPFDKEKCLAHAVSGGDEVACLALRALYENKAPELLEVVRGNLNFRPECLERSLYAAYLLGKVGDASDIPNLIKLYFQIENMFVDCGFCPGGAFLEKRNIMDAMELIMLRKTGVKG